jgi:hypothetical protein
MGGIEMVGHKFRLVNRDGSLFEEVELRISDPEAILLGEKIYLPTKKSGIYRECRLAIAPMPYHRSLQGV